MSRHLVIAMILAVMTATLRAAPTTQPALAPPTKAQHAFFEAKIRPVLVTKCYQCHSVEERKSKGGLVLDTREGWQRGGEGGPVIVPGEPAKSKLLKAVRYEDPDLQMPPKGEKLTDAELAAVEQWIKMGAPDPRDAPADHASKLTGMNDAAKAHWAFQPVKPPAVPAPSDPTGWIKNPLDAFVLAKLDENGLKPSKPASKEALIRRATYDLIGLPPTPQEVEAFVKDGSPDAFAQVVDRLLASPHYGERWGRYWLDTARYSDTTGNDQGKGEYRYPFAWTYRDYVIRSFNEDKPYDEFLKEQIAADLLPESKQDPTRLAALGFITVGKRFQNPNDTIDERIDAVTKGTMALTVSCARCHDHKFDPVPTADYYSLHGIFASTTEPNEKPLIAEATPSGPDYDEFRRQLAEREAKSRELYFNLIEGKSAEFRKKAAAYLLVGTIGRKGATAEQLQLRYEVIAENKLDRDIYQGGLRRIRPNDPVFAPLFAFAQIPEPEFSQRAPAVLDEISNPSGKRRQRVNPLVREAFAKVSPNSLNSLRDVTEVYGQLFASLDGQAEAYLDACRTATTSSVRGFDDDLVELLGNPTPIEPAPALTSDRMRELAPQMPVVNQGGYQRLQLASINELMLTHPASPARAMVVEDSAKPRNSAIFIRGEQQNRGPIVPRRFIEVIAGEKRKPFTSGSGRLALANAIATKDNPLTARVAINRIWMHHFGQGFVRTADDLGVQSELPSHPELLDYLAHRFATDPSTSSGQGDGWSVKAMHRLIMLSSTYQQSSETNPAFAERDPANRLLWRANLRRLDFEAVRDSMLVFTGMLDQTLGGKPVNLTDEPYSRRRSVYGYIDRGDLPELMSQFDFADPDMANSQRTTTIVPQQALFFMNSPMSVDAARKVTDRPEFTQARDDAGRVKALYEVLFQRPPRAEEVRMATAFIRSSEADDDDASADKVVAARSTKAQARDAERAARIKAAREKKQTELAAKRKGNARTAIRNEGEPVERTVLTPWEQLAQALLFTNEIAYVN